MNNKFLPVFVMLALCSVILHAQNINTIAGTGTAGYSGDSSTAVSADINFPSGAAVDAAGNVYIADYLNSRIRKIDVSGVIYTVAGNGTAGYNGDSIAATTAQLNQPWAVAVDGIGNIYITDNGNHRVRMIDTAGIITTVAGTGTAGYNGDGGPATSAELFSPDGITMDGSGNIYVTDPGAFCVRMINPSGIISTITGNGTPGFSGDGGPATSALVGRVSGIATDAIGNVYFSDDGLRIRKINTAGNINTIAGNGAGGYNGDGIVATSATLYGASGVAVDAIGNIYIADAQNNRIRMVDTADTISTVVGTGVAGFYGDGGSPVLAKIYLSTGVSVDGSGNLYVSDYGNQRVRKIDYTTGIGSLKGLGKDLKLYPNGNNGSFSISGRIMTKKSSLQVQIIDVTGKVILKDAVSIHNGTFYKQFKLSESTAPGHYFVKIISENGNAILNFEKK